MHILLIEGDLDLGRAVDAPATVACVLLNLTLPDGSGFDLLARWPSISNCLAPRSMPRIRISTLPSAEGVTCTPGNWRNTSAPENAPICSMSLRPTTTSDPTTKKRSSRDRRAVTVTSSSCGVALPAPSGEPCDHAAPPAAEAKHVAHTAKRRLLCIAGFIDALSVPNCPRARLKRSQRLHTFCTPVSRTCTIPAAGGSVASARGDYSLGNSSGLR
ncbi:hypothetical protein ATF69_0163 [Acidovorax delafieldii]|uniref:Uncharacterized protein n=1 Tax=Acidovorax delafieldii TaxID=47920 RepID=A0A561XYJ4_ACIDE|nr:hypothetical protein [Acidovorax delafieldii]TWG41179.1 hypothetical protein ATF69_0163 [Acidovorax delafieldii]